MTKKILKVFLSQFHLLFVSLLSKISGHKFYSLDADLFNDMLKLLFTKSKIYKNQNNFLLTYD